MKPLLLLALLVGFTNPAHALYTELGVSYSFMKRTIDSLNGNESQSTTGSVSLYFWEKLAFELSYTSGLYVKKEKESSLTTSTMVRETTQASEVFETNIIYLLTERKVRFQPYLKLGAAHIRKKQSVFIDGIKSFEITPDPQWGPSYGAGMKFFFTEELAFRLSYDVVRTPIDNASFTEDVTMRAGLSWVL